jgi:hypothetical protein
MLRTILTIAVMLCASLSTASAEWYSNGNLHQKTIRDWKQASEQNRLATAADMVTAIHKPQTRKELNTVTKLQAVALVICINGAGADAHSNNFKVVDIAAACMVLMQGKGAFR